MRYIFLSLANPMREERELLRKKRLLGLLGGGGQGNGVGGLLDLGSLLGGLGQTVNGLTQGLGLGGILGRRKRFVNDYDADDEDYGLN